jgi:hypothetical protein
MRFFKNYLFLLLVFLYSNCGNAELIGGHDRQRLNLIFSNLLTQSFQNSPISINTATFPVTLVNTEQNIPAIRLYNVLAEEGYLNKQLTVVETSGDRDSVTQGIQFELTREVSTDRIIVCDIVLSSIKSIEQIPTEDDTVKYTVAFNWRTTNLAPWIWAPALATNKDIVKVKNSEESPSDGEATFLWQSDRWVVSELQPLFK